MQERNLRQAVAGTPMLEKAPRIEHSASLGPRFFHRTTRASQGKATIYIQARQSIRYSDRTKQFNMLTAPVTRVLAWPMKLLFADNGSLFVGELQEAMQ